MIQWFKASKLMIVNLLEIKLRNFKNNYFNQKILKRNLVILKIK